jgi:chemotaxis family two-component system response regulator Rcp1
MTEDPSKVCTTRDAKNSSPPELVPEILVADDNPADVYLIREALKEHGVKCAMHVAPDGKEVLQMISGPDLRITACRFGLIILDLNLPRHDGLEILQKLRETPVMDSVPVVVLTSSDSPRDREEANQLGASYYLRKPSSLEQFLALGAVFKDLLGQPDTKLRNV